MRIIYWSIINETKYKNRGCWSEYFIEILKVLFFCLKCFPSGMSLIANKSQKWHKQIPLFSKTALVIKTFVIEFEKLQLLRKI